MRAGLAEQKHTRLLLSSTFSGMLLSTFCFRFRVSRRPEGHLYSQPSLFLTGIS